MSPHPQQSDRAFGLTFSAVFFLVAAVAYLGFGLVLQWALAVSVAFLTTALAAPWILLPLNRLWGLVAARLGLANNYLLLGIFFYLVVLPAGLLMRLFVDPMKRGISRTAQSYWTPVGRKADRDTYRDLF
jgi:hypothetical protein